MADLTQSELEKQGTEGVGALSGSPPNLGDDSKDIEALKEKEREALREKEKEEEERRNLEMQEIERRRRILLDQDNALAKQEEIVNQNWEILRAQRQQISEEAYDLEQGIKHRVHLEKDSPSRKRRRDNSRDSERKETKKRRSSEKSHKSKKRSRPRESSRSKGRRRRKVVISPPKITKKRSHTPRRSTKGRRVDSVRKEDNAEIKEKRKEEKQHPNNTKAKKGSYSRSRRRRSQHSERKGRRSNSEGKKKKRSRHRDRSSSSHSGTSSVDKDTKVALMADQMRENLEGRSKFTHFKSHHYKDAALLFTQCGFDSWETISKLTEETRKYLREDLRKVHKCTANQLSLINEIFSHYELDKGRDTSQTKEKDVKFEEPVIPNRLRRWTADLSQISAFLIPDQEMANVFAREFHLAEKKDPPFIPLVVPDLSKKPWCVPLASHERANKSWKDSVQHKNKDQTQLINLQSYLLYNLRFLLTGDMLDAWHSFGGLSAQLNHLSIVLHLAVVESVSYALSYDQELKAFAQRQARKRDTDTDFYRLFSEENDDIKRTIKTEWEKKARLRLGEKGTKGDLSIKGSFPRKGGEKGDKGKNGKGVIPRRPPFKGKGRK